MTSNYTPSTTSITSSAQTSLINPRNPNLQRSLELKRVPSAQGMTDNRKAMGIDSLKGNIATERPNANSPTKLPDNICPQVTPSLDNAASLPVVNIYLEITGNLKPGAKVLVSSLENNIFPFAPVLVDETSTSPYIFFMPTVKLTEQALKADGNDPIKVLNSPSYYTEFLQRSSIEQSCKSLRNQLFDNVKHNINYIEKLFFPIGGKIMLPQMIPGRTGTQGYEYYRINSVSYKPMEPSYKLPNNKSIADPDSTRQTLITKLNKILRDIEEEPMPSLPQQEEIISEFNKNNNELEKLNNQVDNISKSITKNQDIINTLKPKIKKEKLEDSLQQSKNKDIYDSLLSENNIDTIDLGKYSTPLMKEYLNILKKIKKEKADREQVQKAAEDLQAKVIQNINQRKQLQADTKKIQEQIIQKRQKLFKLQELINASKGGWLIDKGSNSDIDKGEWLTTKNGFAFPRVYNILFSIRVTPINDNETIRDGIETTWGLDCYGKATYLDRIIGQIINKNKNKDDEVFNVFKEFISSYEPPWSPFATPTAFSGEGQRTAQSADSKEQLLKAQQADQLRQAQLRQIRVNEMLARRRGMAFGSDSGITENDLYGYAINNQNAAQALLQQQRLSMQGFNMANPYTNIQASPQLSARSYAGIPQQPRNIPITPLSLSRDSSTRTFTGLNTDGSSSSNYQPTYPLNLTRDSSISSFGSTDRNMSNQQRNPVIEQSDQLIKSATKPKFQPLSPIPEARVSKENILEEGTKRTRRTVRPGSEMGNFSLARRGGVKKTKRKYFKINHRRKQSRRKPSTK